MHSDFFALFHKNSDEHHFFLWQHGEKNKREAVRKEKGIKMTAKELNLAARTVFAEAATEGLNGQMAVPVRASSNSAS